VGTVERWGRRIATLLVLIAVVVAVGACQSAGGVDEAVEQPGAGEETAEEQAAPVEQADVKESEPVIESVSLLQDVLQRGDLVCGVNDQLPGFGYVTPEGEYRGFDVDYCRAIAAALFNDPGAVVFRPLSAQERFTALQTGEVDVLVRNTTWTASRDSQVALDFATTTFYDGQGMMVRVDSGIESLEDLDGASICVQSGTTTEKNLADGMRRIGAEFTPVVFLEPDQTYGAYDEGRCDGATSDKSQLVSRQTTLAEPEAHKILDVTMSKEPLGPAVLQGDPQWADVVRWVVNGTIQAEEFGITSANIDEFLASEDPEIRRFLGLEDALGQGLGLQNDFMVNVIRGVGNYAEIYDRNLGPETRFKLPRGLNKLWTDGGLLYSPPFR